jgi:hypothetical protein
MGSFSVSMNYRPILPGDRSANDAGPPSFPARLLEFAFLMLPVVIAFARDIMQMTASRQEHLAEV